jgi:hypothetical protein
MAATIVSSSAATNVVFGCTAETGIIVNSFSRQVSREKVEVTDNDGDIIAVSYYKPTASISISGMINGSTGVAAAAPGVALTLASTTSGNGITTGKVIVDSVSLSQSSEGFSEFSVEGTQYPELT